MSATPIRVTTTGNIGGLSLLDHHALEDVGHVLAAVSGLLKVVEDLLPLDHGDRILLFVEQVAQRLVVYAVGLVLQVLVDWAMTLASSRAPNRTGAT